MEWGLKKALDRGIKPQATMVFNLSRFSMANMDYNIVNWLIQQLTNNYPETLRHILVVEAPWVFSLCWNLIKGWLDPKTSQKIVFLSMPELKKYIHEDNLPKVS
eukprot:TRINITY_DN482_c0_g1_i4.p2 TRINITY_DN482_c0_g1~~TRINITY_DN482_c0_g1_i4.p2  ORF type:complete len:104 (-),score=21.08 TRINITY_DN482_c0_g1_i4:194-505(-)